MRPPPPPRMGVSSLRGPVFNPNPFYNNNKANIAFNRKPNSCGNERIPDERIVAQRMAHLRMNEKPPEMTNGHADPEKKANGNEGESEPEWYTNPASVDDIVDLHGFEEGDIENQPQPKIAPASADKGYGTPSLAYRRSGYNQNRSIRPNYGNVQTGYNNNNNNGAYGNNTRFRNPLHYNRRKILFIYFKIFLSFWGFFLIL